MPRPSFDKSTGWWAIRYVDTEGRRRKVPLQRQPNWNPGDRPPRKPSALVQTLAIKYQEIAVAARHGVDATPKEPIDLVTFGRQHRAVWSAAKQPATVRSFDRAWKSFLAHCGTEGVATVQAVGARTCRGYMAWRIESGAARNSVKLDRAHLSHLWESAVVDGLVTINPWKREPVPGKAREERPDFWERPELARLIAACRPVERDLVVLGVNTGLRAQNLCDLQWSEVNLRAGHLEIPASKTKAGKPVRIPLNPDALAVLSRRKANTQGPRVFPGFDGRSNPPTPASLASRLIRARKRAGLPAKRHPCHILRHTFATHAARVVPLPILQQWLGHASITMTMRYVHVSEAESVRYMGGFCLTANEPLLNVSPGTPDPEASGAS